MRRWGSALVVATGILGLLACSGLTPEPRVIEVPVPVPVPVPAGEVGDLQEVAEVEVDAEAPPEVEPAVEPEPEVDIARVEAGRPVPARPSPAPAPVAPGSCPSGADRRSRFDAGTRVRLLSTHPDDAYHGSLRAPIEGTVDGDLHNNGDCWFGGGFDGDDGTSYYFYKASFAFVSAPSQDKDAVSCPAGALTSGTVTAGNRVRVLATHPDDAYHGSLRFPIDGRVDGDIHSNDGCWFGGGFVGDDGTSYYFYKAAFTRLSAPAPSSNKDNCPSGAVALGRVGNGTRVVLVDLNPEDAYYSSGLRSRLPLHGRVDGDLHSNDDCWLGGGMVGDDGQSYYFYKGAFRLE